MTMGWKTRTWQKRQRQSRKIGWMYFVHPSSGERYYLRMLLLVVKGAQSYDSVRTYNNITYSTFKEAWNACGLLSNDQEWYNAFDEAANWATSGQLKQLFVTMLLFCEVGDEFKFFEKIWRLLADNIQYNVRQTLNHQTYQMSDIDLRDEVLERLDTLFNRRGRHWWFWSSSKICEFLPRFHKSFVCWRIKLWCVCPSN
jgi:hypothetical protein